MTQEEIRAILSLADNHQNGGCGPINELFDEHISHVDERIAELTQLKTQLTELRQRCLSARPDAEDCGILHGERDAGRAAGAARTWADGPFPPRARHNARISRTVRAAARIPLMPAGDSALGRGDRVTYENMILSHLASSRPRPAPREFQIRRRHDDYPDRLPLHALTSRRSVKFLRAPAPKQDELEQILQAAMSAPDHGALRPWRFVLIRGEAIGKLADVAIGAVKRSGDPRMTPGKVRARMDGRRAAVHRRGAEDRARQHQDPGTGTTAGHRRRRHEPAERRPHAGLRRVLEHRHGHLSRTCRTRWAWTRWTTVSWATWRWARRLARCRRRRVRTP